MIPIIETAGSYRVFHAAESYTGQHFNCSVQNPFIKQSGVECFMTPRPQGARKHMSCTED